MKKIILLILIGILMASCAVVTNQKDPLDFKGCVVDNKKSIFNYRSFTLKLVPDSLKQKYNYSYITVEVSIREYELYQIGDTIK